MDCIIAKHVEGLATPLQCHTLLPRTLLCHTSIFFASLFQSELDPVNPYCPLLTMKKTEFVLDTYSWSGEFYLVRLLISSANVSVVFLLPKLCFGRLLRH